MPKMPKIVASLRSVFIINDRKFAILGIYWGKLNSNSPPQADSS